MNWEGLCKIVKKKTSTSKERRPSTYDRGKRNLIRKKHNYIFFAPTPKVIVAITEAVCNLGVYLIN